jgi:hypothetical protein
VRRATSFCWEEGEGEEGEEKRVSAVVSASGEMAHKGLSMAWSSEFISEGWSESDTSASCKPGEGRAT